MPGKINSLGIGSGVLNSDVIAKLRSADEAATIAPIDRKIATNIEKQKELIEVNTHLSAFKAPVSGLADYSTYIARKTTASNDAISATASPGVPLQDIDVDVKGLASNDVNEVGKKFASKDEEFTNQDVRLNLFSNGKHYDIDVKAGMTLSDVAQAITDASKGEVMGIAMKVGGEKPYQLVINSKNTGANNRIYFGSTLATRQVKNLDELKDGDLTVILKDKYYADRLLDIKISKEDARGKNKTEILFDAIQKAIGSDEDLKELVDSKVLNIGLSKSHDSIVLNDRRGYQIEFGGSKLDSLGLDHTTSKLDELFTTKVIPEGLVRGLITIGTIPMDLANVTAEGNSSEDNAKALAAAIDNIQGLHANADRNGKLHLESEIGEVAASSQSPGGEKFLKAIGLKNGVFKDYIALQQDVFNFKKLKEASDSKIIINGKEIMRDTNTINDVINGVNITLNHTTKEGEPATLRILQDKEAITNKIQDLVKTYNELAKKLDVDTRYDPDSKVAGVFNGENDIRNIRPRINSLITQTILTKDQISKSLVNYGLKLDDKSALTFDPSELNSELDKDPQKVIDTLYGYDKKDPLGKNRHVDGLFVNMNSYLKQLSDGPNSSLELFSSSLSKDARKLDEDKKTANERLSAKYDNLERRFGSFDEKIAQMNGSFNSLKMMIDQSVAKK